MSGETVTLAGEPTLGRTGILLKAMLKTIRKERGGVLVELNVLEGEAEVAEAELPRSCNLFCKLTTMIEHATTSAT